MAQIRIDTEHAREVGRRLVAEGNRVAEIGQELRRAIGGLDTWAWDGASRWRAEPLLGRVGPESAQLAQELAALGQTLVRAAGIFEYEDTVAAGHVAGMPWVSFDASGPAGGWLTTVGAHIPGAVATAGAALMGGVGVAGGLSAVAGREFGFWPPAWSWEGQLWKEEWAGSTRLGGVRFGGAASAELLKGELGIGLDWDKAEAYARATALHGEADGLIGSTDLGLGAHGELTVGEVEAVAEYSWSEGRAAWGVGGTLAAVEGDAGVKLGGGEVGVSGGVGLQLKLGMEFDHGVEVDIGPFEVGFKVKPSKKWVQPWKWG